MAIFLRPRRVLIAGGFVAVIAAAPAVAAVAGPLSAAPAVAACPTGELNDSFTGVCVPDLVPNSPEPFTTNETSPGGLPEVDNIPCTGANSGQCIGLSEEQQAEGPIAEPRTSISSSP